MGGSYRENQTGLDSKNEIIYPTQLTIYGNMIITILLSSLLLGQYGLLFITGTALKSH